MRFDIFSFPYYTDGRAANEYSAITCGFSLTVKRQSPKLQDVGSSPFNPCHCFSISKKPFFSKNITAIQSCYVSYGNRFYRQLILWMCSSMVEHKTFNLAVDGSSPFTFTTRKKEIP